MSLFEKQRKWKLCEFNNSSYFILWWKMIESNVNFPTQEKRTLYSYTYFVKVIIIVRSSFLPLFDCKIIFIYLNIFFIDNFFLKSMRNLRYFFFYLIFVYMCYICIFIDTLCTKNRCFSRKFTALIVCIKFA